MKNWFFAILFLSALMANLGCNKVTTTCAPAYLMNTFLRVQYDSTTGQLDTVVTVSNPPLAIPADICWTSAKHTGYWPTMTGPKGYVPMDSLYCHNAHKTGLGYQIYGGYDCYNTTCGMGLPALVNWH